MSIISVFAHPERLNVVYDACVPDENDGLDEMWYNLEAPNSNTPYLCQHLDHQITTLKYIFSEYGEDGITTWDTGSDENMALTIKTIVAEGMEKWNNVYFYSYDSLGNIVKKKIINVVEVFDVNDANLIIYPSCEDWAFATFKAINDEEPEGEARTNHHFSKCKITIFLPHYLSDIRNTSTGTLASERASTHEIGHILGLVDIDSLAYCGSSEDVYHHQELLMGYSLTGKLASVEITYKDIAGVAIARGFHTDNDHKWLNMGYQTDGTYKLVCSICNGVKYVNSLNGYATNTYGLCDGEHDIQGGNMMAVASYGTKDYYKCKYCRYVAPFENLIEQNNGPKTYYSDEYHVGVNYVQDLEYTFYEEHVFENGQCISCNVHEVHSYTYDYINASSNGHYAVCSCGARILEQHDSIHECDQCGYYGHSYTVEYINYSSAAHYAVCSCGAKIVQSHNSIHECSKCGYYGHSYTDHYEKHNAAGHYAYCSCGDRIEQAHVLMRPVGGSVGGLSICKYCGASVSFGVLDSIPTDYPHTENGSYILPSGIIVLVPEDEEAYLNGTLEFRTGEIM